MPHQFVREPAEVDLPLSDLSDLSSQDAVQRATEIAAADTLRAYDLADGPLIRPRLIRITEDDHRLYLGLHHLVWDGTTLHRVVFPELVCPVPQLRHGRAVVAARPARRNTPTTRCGSSTGSADRR